MFHLIFYALRSYISYKFIILNSKTFIHFSIPNRNALLLCFNGLSVLWKSRKQINKDLKRIIIVVCYLRAVRTFFVFSLVAGFLWEIAGFSNRTLFKSLLNNFLHFSYSYFSHRKVKNKLKTFTVLFARWSVTKTRSKITRKQRNLSHRKTQLFWHHLLICALETVLTISGFRV